MNHVNLSQMQEINLQLIFLARNKKKHFGFASNEGLRIKNTTLVNGTKKCFTVK